MAVDKYKAYQMCIAMGNPPSVCGQRYNTPNKKTSEKQEKPPAEYKTYSS